MNGWIEMAHTIRLADLEAIGHVTFTSHRAAQLADHGFDDAPDRHVRDTLPCDYTDPHGLLASDVSASDVSLTGIALRCGLVVS